MYSFDMHGFDKCTLCEYPVPNENVSDVFIGHAGIDRCIYLFPDYHMSNVNDVFMWHKCPIWAARVPCDQSQWSARLPYEQCELCIRWTCRLWKKHTYCCPITVWAMWVVYSWVMQALLNAHYVLPQYRMSNVSDVIYWTCRHREMHTMFYPIIIWAMLVCSSDIQVLINEP